MSIGNDGSVDGEVDRTSVSNVGDGRNRTSKQEVCIHGWPLEDKDTCGPCSMRVVTEYQGGWDAGFDSAVNLMRQANQAPLSTQCRECGLNRGACMC